MPLLKSPPMMAISSRPPLAAVALRPRYLEALQSTYCGVDEGTLSVAAVWEDVAQRQVGDAAAAEVVERALEDTLENCVRAGVVQVWSSGVKPRRSRVLFRFRIWALQPVACLGIITSGTVRFGGVERRPPSRLRFPLLSASCPSAA